MGASLSALEIYERLHLWERVISCYQAVGRLSQAERIVRERMEADGESVLLWCLLGDMTQVSNTNNNNNDDNNNSNNNNNNNNDKHCLCDKLFRTRIAIRKHGYSQTKKAQGLRNLLDCIT